MAATLLVNHITHNLRTASDTPLLSGLGRHTQPHGHEGCCARAAICAIQMRVPDRQGGRDENSFTLRGVRNEWYAAYRFYGQKGDSTLKIGSPHS